MEKWKINNERNGKLTMKGMENQQWNQMEINNKKLSV